MPPYSRGFDFDATQISRNLAVLDEQIENFIDQDVDLHERKAELEMKTKAPWRDHTGAARRTLWAKGTRTGKNVHFELGHGQDYGIYLEENNEKRFAIVEPTLRALGQSFMRSLERMFLQLQAHTPPAAAIVPDVGATRPNTTRPEVVQTTDSRGQTRFRHKGRFIAASEAKRLAKNAAQRARYAAKKAAGTLPTRRTKRG